IRSNRGPAAASRRRSAGRTLPDRGPAGPRPWTAPSARVSPCPDAELDAGAERPAAQREGAGDLGRERAVGAPLDAGEVPQRVRAFDEQRQAAEAERLPGDGAREERLGRAGGDGAVVGVDLERLRAHEPRAQAQVYARRLVVGIERDGGQVPDGAAQVQPGRAGLEARGLAVADA